jgi:hypothetical protein
MYFRRPRIEFYVLPFEMVGCGNRRLRLRDSIMPLTQEVEDNEPTTATEINNHEQ